MTDDSSYHTLTLLIYVPNKKYLDPIALIFKTEVSSMMIEPE